MNENWNYKLTKCRIGDESLLLNSFQQRSLKPIPVDAIFRGLPAHHSKFPETLAQPTHTRLIPIDGYGPTSTTDQWSTWTANAAFSLSLSLSKSISLLNSLFSRLYSAIASTTPTTQQLLGHWLTRWLVPTAKSSAMQSPRYQIF